MCLSLELTAIYTSSIWSFDSWDRLWIETPMRLHSTTVQHIQYKHNCVIIKIYKVIDTRELAQKRAHLCSPRWVLYTQRGATLTKWQQQHMRALNTAHLEGTKHTSQSVGSRVLSRLSNEHRCGAACCASPNTYQQTGMAVCATKIQINTRKKYIIIINVGIYISSVTCDEYYWIITLSPHEIVSLIYLLLVPTSSSI